jgi:hypothetical protein
MIARERWRGLRLPVLQSAVANRRGRRSFIGRILRDPVATGSFSWLGTASNAHSDFRAAHECIIKRPKHWSYTSPIVRNG